MMDAADAADDLAVRLPCLREFAAAGQDKAAVARLYEVLLEELEPQNLIERLWIRDVAVLTIRSEELRLVQVAVHKVAMQRSQSGLGALPAGGRPGANETATNSGTTAVAAYADGSSPSASSQSSDTLVEQAVGMTYAENLAVISAVADMEVAVRKDRDRILSQIDLHRRHLKMDLADAILQALKRSA